MLSSLRLTELLRGINCRSGAQRQGMGEAYMEQLLYPENYIGRVGEREAWPGPKVVIITLFTVIRQQCDCLYAVIRYLMDSSILKLS